MENFRRFFREKHLRKVPQNTFLWISGRQPLGCGPVPARTKFVAGPYAFSDKGSILQCFEFFIALEIFL